VPHRPEPMLSLRDPVHGFIKADPLEAALIASRPLQRLRWIRQLGMMFFVFPGAEHSRFSHAVGAMELAGRLYDALAAKAAGLLDPSHRAPARRLVRAAGLLHDIGHAPFSHSAEELFDEGIDHEAMTGRLLALPEIQEIFAAHGDGLEPGDVARLLHGGEGPVERLLSQVISGELDVDKMDYLLRDSLFCGVRYGNYDLPRLLDTVAPIRDPVRDEWGIGIVEGGVHALEALVLARYYMFTQVYFNVTGKAIELHLSAWLLEQGVRWPADPEAFLQEDDVAVLARMRTSDSVHARAVLRRDRFPLAYETREHLTPEQRGRFAALLPELRQRFGADNLLVSYAAKDPHRLGASRVFVQRFDGRLEPVEEASQFIRHLSRIESYRVYAPPGLRQEVATSIKENWEE
jgi:HD superfamily phosphohydrolase